MQPDVVTQACDVLRHSLFLQVIKPDVPVVFLDPGYNGIPGLSNVVLPTLAGDAVHALYFQAKVIFDGLKETVVTFLGRRPTVTMDSTQLQWLKVGPTVLWRNSNCPCCRCFCLCVSRWIA
jgi:hypothetical protein